MTEPTIYMDHNRQQVPISDVSKEITDDWIDGGHYCDDTVFNLRDAVVYQQAEIEQLKAECDIYRKALLKMTEAPRMDQPGELPRYVAKDALRDGIKARDGE